MRLSLFTYFLTLVLGLVLPTSTWAAPDKAIAKPPIDISPIDNSDQNNKAAELDPSVQITVPPKTNKPKNLNHFPVDASSVWHITIGYLQGVVKPDHVESKAVSYGISKVQYYADFTSRELSLESLSDSVLVLQYGHRWSALEGGLQGSYYKVGGALNFEAFDGLANIVNYKRYQVRGAMGFDNLFRSHNRFGSELGLGFSFSGLCAYLQLFFAF